MKRGPKLTPVAIMANRMKPLARSHRIAHLRADPAAANPLEPTGRTGCIVAR